MGYEVRVAEKRDAEAISMVLRRSIRELCVVDHLNDPEILGLWLGNKSPDDVLGWLADDGNFCVVTEGDFGVCGVGMITRRGELRLCYLLAEARFHGLGRRLMMSLEAQAASWKVAEVFLRSTAVARSFYERWGYSSSGAPVMAWDTVPSFPYSKTLAAALVVRPARREDAPRLHELHTASVRMLCAPYYRPDVIDGWLLNRNPNGYLPPIEHGSLFVAETNGTVVAFGEAAPGVVVAVYVDPSATSRGVGRTTLRHAIDLARRNQAGPIRVESTLNASTFYEKHGFREIARSTLTRNHVDVPVVVMELPPERDAALTLRSARDLDRDFCFRVTKAAMRSYVEAAFGPWNDQAQRRYFEESFTSLPHEVIAVGTLNAGFWSVVREPKRLVLKKMYLLPEFQRQGVGSALLRRLIRESEVSRLPIELRYLKVNPVASLYARLGFQRVKEEVPHVYVRREP